MTTRKRATLDAAETLFLERELEHKLALSRDVKYAATEARKFVPVNNEGSGAMTIVSDVYDYKGRAKVVASHADDVPLVNSTKTETRLPVKSIADGFLYTIEEIKAAAKAGTQLTDRHMRAARRVIEERLDELAALGDSDAGIVGFARRSDTLTYTVPGDGADNSKLWSKKDAAKILRDINGAISKMLVDTNDVEKPDTLLVDPGNFAILANTPVNSTSDTTILAFIKATSPWIKDVASWNRLTKAGGSLNTTRMIAYRRDPEALELYIPDEFDMLPPQPENLAFKVPCMLRTAGVGVHYPKSIVYADGI